MGRLVDWFRSRKAVETNLPVPKLPAYHGANSVSVSWEMRRDCLSVRARLSRLAECEASFFADPVVYSVSLGKASAIFSFQE